MESICLEMKVYLTTILNSVFAPRRSMNIIFHLPEADAYLIARVEEKVLHVYQIFGKKQLQPERLISSFSERIEEMVFGYTPVHKEKFLVREHKEEDCTLFILGEDLTRIEENQMMFPILSHA